ncbi:MAG: acetate kinase [Rhodobacterales bacterium]|nr:acetate kinase [Rhodobacterales bacterium]
MLLIVNAGSSSLKLVFFDGQTEVRRETVEEIGPDGHAAALDAALKRAGIAAHLLTGAAHRVVHGGPSLTAACRITPAVLDAITAAVPLAPLHNPASLHGIQAVTRLFPDLPQYAIFDTAFHATNPEVATTYALPEGDRARGIRRYGFHGISYAALVRILSARGALPRRLLACHLGNGASLCAIVNGRSIATTMGYSPLDGLTMGTRTGSIDGNAVLRLVEEHGLDRAKVILNRESGLLGLGGSSDMRRLHATATAEARFALEHFAYSAVRHAGSMIAAMGGLDAVVFTGGIGENDPLMRKEILSGLGFLGVTPDLTANARNESILHEPSSRVAIWIVPADEERQIALEAQAVMGREAHAVIAGESA